MKKKQEFYREDMHRDVRKAWFDGGADTTPNYIAKTLRLNSKMVEQSFGSEEGMVAEALAPNGKPPKDAPPDEVEPSVPCAPDDHDVEKLRDAMRSRIYMAFKNLTPDVLPDFDPPNEIEPNER